METTKQKQVWGKTQLALGAAALLLCLLVGIGTQHVLLQELCKALGFLTCLKMYHIIASEHAPLKV